MAMLAERGFTVSRGIPEATLLCPDRLCVRHDLYVLKSRSELALSVAAVLHDRGAQFLNPYPACALAHNRITAASRLAVAGVPVPRCWTTADFAMLCELAAERPVVVKPYRSGGCPSQHVLAHTADDLVGIRLDAQPVLVQEFVAGRGPDLRVKVIGEEVFAVERETDVPVAVAPALHEIALRCGRIFGLSVYALEVVQGVDGPVVVDFHHAPRFTGIADAGARLARHIENVLGGRTLLPRQPPALHVTPGWGGVLQGLLA
jgi:ribosomal protein S6--L-glutamate ligase